MLHTSQIVAGILLLIFMACGGFLSLQAYDKSSAVYNATSKASKPATKKPSYKNLDTAEAINISFIHGVFSLMGTSMLGLSITVFRLLPRTQVKIVARVHMTGHVIAIVLLAIGLWLALKLDSHLTSNHSIISWMTLIILCFQFVIGTTQIRQFVAYFHDLIGIWIFVCCVLCCITGENSAQKLIGDANDVLFCGLSHLCFMLVLIIIISPYFEWDLVF